MLALITFGWVEKNGAKDSSKTISLSQSMWNLMPPILKSRFIGHFWCWEPAGGACRLRDGYVFGGLTGKVASIAGSVVAVTVFGTVGIEGGAVAVDAVVRVDVHNEAGIHKGITLNIFRTAGDAGAQVDDIAAAECDGGIELIGLDLDQRLGVGFPQGCTSSSGVGASV
jgi:hypothetical protein